MDISSNKQAWVVRIISRSYELSLEVSSITVQYRQSQVLSLLGNYLFLVMPFVIVQEELFLASLFVTVQYELFLGGQLVLCNIMSYFW